MADIIEELGRIAWSMTVTEDWYTITLDLREFQNAYHWLRYMTKAHYL